MLVGRGLVVSLPTDKATVESLCHSFRTIYYMIDFGGRGRLSIYPRHFSALGGPTLVIEKDNY